MICFPQIVQLSKLTCAMIKRDNASLNTIKTVSPFSHELTETQFFVHKRARYNDLDKVDDASLFDLQQKFAKKKKLFKIFDIKMCEI